MRPRRKPRKQLRDEEAGLVFAWRIAGGSLPRMVLAILVAAGCFAAGASLVRIKPKTLHEGNRESGSVTLLWLDDPASRDVLDWAQQQSPFPDRWEPRSTGALESELLRVREELDVISRYEPQVRVRPKRLEMKPGLPGLLGTELAGLPPVREVPEEPVTAEILAQVRSIAVANGALAKRWGVRSRAWERDNATELLGRGASFLVGVDPEGTVVFCLLVSSLDEEIDPELNRWLRTHQASPDEKATGLAWDVIRITIDDKVEEIEPVLPDGTP